VDSLLFHIALTASSVKVVIEFTLYCGNGSALIGKHLNYILATSYYTACVIL
jgi:hypothetical protein